MDGLQQCMECTNLVPIDELLFLVLGDEIEIVCRDQWLCWWRADKNSERPAPKASRPLEEINMKSSPFACGACWLVLDFESVDIASPRNILYAAMFEPVVVRCKDRTTCHMRRYHPRWSELYVEIDKEQDHWDDDDD
ncbi:hypothetical protein [Kitasatospora sp. NPDC056800]|uniref:hypothetical protein n=1 Tax=Kitasatospora sp. NPDC056800 TaxID=3345948 RepID=UPI0036AF837F